jgi:hypothetical protein
MPDPADEHDRPTADSPSLENEVRQLRQTVEILWRYMNRDVQPLADDALKEAGLPEVEPGYRWEEEQSASKDDQEAEHA